LKIKDGWLPQGGICLGGMHGSIYLQAMIKDKKK